jgi:hypothetical protein
VVAAGKPLGIAVADGYVVWADRYGRSIWVRDSSGALTKIDGDQETARVSIHGGFVYWTEFNGPSLYRAVLPGGEAVRLGTHEDGYSGTFGQLAVSDSGAYWVHEWPNAAVLSSPLVVQTTDPTPVAPVGPDGYTAGVAVDGEHVYWTIDKDILRKSLSEVGDGLAGQLVSKAPGALALAVDATHVYWFDRSDDGAHVWRAPKDGSEPAPQELAKLDPKPWALVLDDWYVYWTTDTGSVYRTAKDGGGAEKMLASGESEAYDIAQDCAALYWTTEADGIRTVAK